MDLSKLVQTLRQFLLKILQRSKTIFYTVKQKVIKNLREWVYRVVHKLRYIYRLQFWLWLNRLRRLTGFFSNNFNSFRQASYATIALIVGFVVTFFSGIDFTSDILSNYLFAVGAMTGGTIAIVFTISIFLLQNASDLYSSQYFEVYIHDWKEKFVYFAVIFITLILLAGGLFIGSVANDISAELQTLFVILSLFVIGIVFGLIDWQYQNLLRKINPSKAIEFLEKEGIKFLSRLKYDAEKMAGIIQAKDGSLSNEMALASAYNIGLKPFINKLDQQLENLVEIAMKLSDKQEVQTTKRAFTAVHNVLVKFFEARKTSSLIIPSNITFLAVESDSQKFLLKSFERLNKAGEKFIREGKDENATYIIEIYDSLATNAKEVSFIGRAHENPILDLVEGYLNFLIENGQRAKNTEVVFQGVRVLGNISVIAANKGYETTLHGTQEKILKAAIYGLTEKQIVITDQCVSNFLRVIGVVFGSKELVRQHAFDDAVKNIKKITSYTSSLLKSGYLPDNFTTRMSLSKGYDEMYGLIVQIVNHYLKLTDDGEKSRYRRDIIKLFREINLSLRQLSEEVKEADSTLVDSVGRLLFYINNLIIDLILDSEFAGEKKELITLLSWNIHLPGWFAHHAEKFDAGSMRFYQLTDSVAKTGILIAEKMNDKKIVLNCINCLYSMTQHSLKKGMDSHGYDEPRVLEKACYLGIIALKKGWYDVFTELAFKIYEFEPEYFKKYFTNIPKGIDPENHNVIGLPQKDQLFVELLRWRDNFERNKWNRSGIRDDAEDLMTQVVELIDIDRFMFEVWNKFSVDSELKEELDLKRAREKLVQILKRIIQKKSMDTMEVEDKTK